MVHQKNNDTVFDFSTEGIKMLVDGDWVRAKGTTLGADNGMGVAAIMAILESKTIAHPALEALFTTDEETGMKIILKALEAPLRTIVENAGVEGSVVVAKVLESSRDAFGYNAKTDNYCDMFKAGIIDPKKVTRVALENAASVAGMILTTECALVDIKDDKAAAMPPMGGGMPGMM